MTKEKMTKDIELPDGIEAAIKEGNLTIKGLKGTVERQFKSKRVSIRTEAKKIVLESEKNTKRDKKLIGSFMAHIKNMIRGATEGHVYKMKICAGHFPMNVSISNNELIVKNFLGEKVPRKIRLLQGVDVRVEGNEIIIESTSKELAGRTASSIEEKTKRSGFDKRIFQDGIFITQKDSREAK